MTPNRRGQLLVAAAVALSGLAACAGGSSSPLSPGGQDSGGGDGDGAPSTSVDAVEVSPDSVALDPGQQQSFAAEGRDADGGSVAVDVSWSATGGTVTSDGVFTAGDSAGSYRVWARDTSGVADTSRVRVQDDGGGGGGDDGGDDDGGGDDGGGGGSAAVECGDPDPAWVWCDDFEQDRLASYFEYGDDDGDFVRTSGTGLEGSTAMRARFQQGEDSAGDLKLALGRTPGSYFDPVGAGTTDYRELYWRVWIRNESSWTGGGGHKLSRATIFHDDDPWRQAMIAHVWSGGDPDEEDYLVIDPASGTDEAGNVQTTSYNDFDNLRWLGARRGTTPIFDASHVGEWYCVEAHVRLNEAGASDGVFELWIDGSLEARREGLNWVGDYSAYGINAVFVENYWNGGSPQVQERYLDNFVVSTERIGC